MSLIGRIPLIGRIALVLAALIGGVTLYMSASADRNSAGAPRMAGGTCKPARAVTDALDRVSVNDMAAFQVTREARAVAPLTFLNDAGQRVPLEQWRGRTVLINLWATWCAPCRKEMPALDALQAELGGRDFEVVAINIDTRNVERPRVWLQENGVTRLAYYADPEAKVFQDLKRAGQAVGMPTTILMDANGCHLGVLHGAAEWASADAKALIRTAIGR
jgi:thiol-disulfide isomerase/thioredoxin